VTNGKAEGTAEDGAKGGGGRWRSPMARRGARRPA
jgi:hypothetical protein